MFSHYARYCKVESRIYENERSGGGSDVANQELIECAADLLVVLKNYDIINIHEIVEGFVRNPRAVDLVPDSWELCQMRKEA